MEPQEAWSWLGATVEVLVEAPRGSFVKRRPDGRVDVVSPLPVPWNYGSVPGERGGDGDPLDVILLGPRRPAGWRGTARVCGVVDFVDEGLDDTKLVCGEPGLVTPATIRAFFAVYAPFKRVLAASRGRSGPTFVRDVRWL